MTRRWIVVAVALAGCPGSGPSPVQPEQPEAAPWVAPTLPQLDTFDPGELTWTPDGFAEADARGPIVVDGDRLVWASDEGGVRAAPIAGGPAVVLARFADVVALAVGDEGVYVLSDDALFLLPRDRAPVGLADLSYPEALWIGADEIYVADGDWIRAVPKAGGEPRTLATDAGEPTAITATETHVYWTDGGYDPPPRTARACGIRIHRPGEVEVPAPNDPCSNDQRYGAIKRVPIAGGKVQSRALFYPRAVVAFDGQVSWADTAGEAVTRTDLEGNHREVLLGGPGRELAIDATSTVALTDAGVLVELAADHPPWVKDTQTSGKLALAPDAIYVAETVIRRYPRGPSRTTVLAVPDGKVEDLAVSGDHVYYVDAHFDDRPDAVRRVPRGGGAPELVREHAGDAIDLRVSGEHVVTYDAVTLALDAGAGALASDVAPDAIAVDDRAVYWLQDQYVYAQPFAGGDVETWLQPDENAFAVMYGYGGGKPPASLGVRDGVIVAASTTLDAVVRIDTNPPKPKGKAKPKPWKPKVERFLEGATDGGAAGDELVGWTERGLELADGKLLLPAGEGGWPELIVADARDVWLIRDAQLLRIPLDGSPPQVVLYGVDGAHAALDDDAVYLSVRWADVILRVARR